ncbi:SRPBCC family protein [Lacinutrix sp. Bg11-31]|uniref:SRPBCC family protein n=1 Tax=Lacinutrix sp. Bg11-31 TaxID=2057808 RepID=UPI000C3192B2|nr:SRPBCC family protein [Lacinutrix sp. Bg11-31]AUC80769.1 hypothetical protein CW733_00905 [Lacinutrix sp. Bg11-31]
MKNPATNTLQIGYEYISSDEDKIIQEMIDEMQAQMDRVYAQKKMPRQIHTKMHGCVKAKFIIEPDLKEALKIGVFKTVKTYNCWVRFSNSQSKPQKDKKKDIRGIAIKLMDVQGEKLLNNKRHETTHDFLLMSSETFFSKNIKEFRGTLKASTAKNKLKLLLYFLNPKHWSLLKRLMGTFIKCKNPLEIPYWSTQPYRFGALDKAVKYYLKPSADNCYVNENIKEPHYLKINMAQTLYNHPAKFDFFVQFQTDATTMPIEDPTVPWTSQYVKLATLEIPPQQFNTNKQLEFGENLSFNSWHVLPEHRPLGSFNRVRKRVYEFMAEYRHKKNGVPDVEPKADASFFNNVHIHDKNRINVAIPKNKALKKTAQVTINCSKATAFNFITNGEKLPNWLKKHGSIPAVLYTKNNAETYDFVGAKRTVYLDKNQSTLEELLSYNPFANYSYRITEFTNSIKHFSNTAYAQVWFNTIDDKTRITWDYTFTYKNIFSRLILNLILTFVFKKFMQASLNNAKKYIENGD